jgi:hypothetical protein
VDAKEEPRLLRLFEEVTTDDEYEESASASESKSDDEEPYEESGDDFVPSSCESDDKIKNISLPINEDRGSDSEETSVVTNDNEWNKTRIDIENFRFDDNLASIKISVGETTTSYEIFTQLWDDTVMDTLVKSCNHYGKSLTEQSRPKTRYSRATINKDTDKNELNKFLGLCLLQGQVRFPSIIKAFSHKPLYYHPLFKATMSGRRFEQLLRCFSCSSGDKNIGKHRLAKINPLFGMLL